MRENLKFRTFRALPRALRRTIMFRRYRREIGDSGEAELDQLRHLVRYGELALDVGCNLGVYTYELSRLTGHVVAFEPNPILASLVSSLRLPGVEVRQIALSSDDGRSELLIPRSGGGHGLASLRGDAVAGREVERVTVPMERLDDQGLRDVSFIKIDVEGFEEEVLAGGWQTIARDRPKLLIEIEERHNRGGLDRIRRRLQDASYSGYFFCDDCWHSIEAFDPSAHQHVSEEIEEVGKSVDRRRFRYVNNFLFLPSGHSVQPPGKGVSAALSG